MHRERPFFRDLVKFMTSGPVMVQVLEGENAIARNRELMGATDPKKAAKGTIRADFAAFDRRQRGARLRRAGDGAHRNRVLLSAEVHSKRVPALVQGRERECDPMKDNLLGLDAGALGALLRRAARSPSARARCCAGCIASARPISRA